MKKIEIKKTLHQPHVVLDPSDGTMLFEGKSIVPNATEFFGNILDWIREYTSTVSQPKITVDFKLEYFNTASSKMILQLLLLLKEAERNGTEILFNWHYYEDDDDMMDIAEEAEMLSELKINYVVME